MNCGKLTPNVAIFGLKTTFLEFLHSFLGVLKIFKHLFKSLKLRWDDWKTWAICNRVFYLKCPVISGYTRYIGYTQYFGFTQNIGYTRYFGLPDTRRDSKLNRAGSGIEKISGSGRVLGTRWALIVGIILPWSLISSFGNHFEKKLIWSDKGYDGQIISVPKRKM